MKKGGEGVLSPSPVTEYLCVRGGPVTEYMCVAAAPGRWCLHAAMIILRPLPLYAVFLQCKTPPIYLSNHHPFTQVYIPNVVVIIKDILNSANQQNKQHPITSNHLTQKRQRRTVFEIQALPWDRHKHVVGLKRVMASYPL